MSGIEQFDEIVGMDLGAAVAEVVHKTLCIKTLPHNTPEFSKFDKLDLVDDLIARLENVKLRIKLERD